MAASREPLTAVTQGCADSTAFATFVAGTSVAPTRWMLGWVAAGWVVGLLLGAYRGEPGVGLGMLAIPFALALVWHGQELRARLWALPLFGLACLAGLGVAPSIPPSCSTRGHVVAEARVERVRFGVEEARVRLRVIEGHWTQSRAPLAEGLRIDLARPLDSAPRRGAHVRYSGAVRPRTHLQNPSLRPLPRTLQSVSCWGATDAELAVVPVEGAISNVRQAIDRARRRIRSRMIDQLPDDVAGVARALVLGDGAALPYARRKMIAAVGLAHLFAVSGLHIALVSGTLVALLHWALRGWFLRLDPLRVAAAVGAPLTLLHASFAGGSPSAWRAAITAAITWGVVLLGRRPSAPAVTAVAALLLSAPDPSTGVRPAFLLSIVATAAILAAPRAAPGRWRRLRTAASISSRTLIATTPMVWWWFGGVPLVGWLTNIVVLPFGSFVVIPLAHAFALAADVPQLGGWLAALLCAAVRLLLLACEVFSTLAWTERLPPLDPLQAATVAAACVALLFARSWRQRTMILLCAGVLWAGEERRIISRERPRGLVRTTFLDVGQGDAALIDLPDGRVMLIDTGRGDRHPAGRELLRLLRERRRPRIDIAVVTHGHPDHFGALPALLEQVTIGEIWLNGQRLAEEQDGVMHALVTTARAKGTRVMLPDEFCGTHRFGEAELSVLWPCPRYEPELDLNDNSITLVLRFWQHAFLFTGDLEADAERRLLRQRPLGPIDVLKVAHHGSKTSTTEAFLATVQPKLAVMSAGRYNRYGHPHPDVLARLENAAIDILRTDVHGAVVIRTDGRALAVDTTSGRP